MSQGGKRPGAGRPKKPEKREQIWPTIRKATHRKLQQDAFNGPKSIGEVIDTWADEREKKSVDTRKKKK